METKEVDLLSSLDKFDYYSDLDNDLFLAAVTVWVMVLVVTKLKSISSTDMANLAICLPLFFNMILMSI
ncbi:hypothetical protein [Vibrio diabolicus]|uniref:hypothetical protein n=1 Tax=Vibrio diabolicus TaxID=50719 RepID=UPI001D04B308|nr:hypothetical protein [Vibrio diabolicus]